MGTTASGERVGPVGAGREGRAVVDQLRWLAGMGVRTVFGRVVGDHAITPIETMGREVIPAVADV